MSQRSVVDDLGHTVAAIERIERYTAWRTLETDLPSLLQTV